MFLAILLLVNNFGLFVAEIIGHHLSHSVVLLLCSYFHLSQGILCLSRVLAPRVQSIFNSRQTYGFVRVGVIGELISFIAYVVLSITVLLEILSHLVHVIWIIPKREHEENVTFSAHGHSHVHSLIDSPKLILVIGLYATVSNLILGAGVFYTAVKRDRKTRDEWKQRRPSLTHPLPKQILSKSLLFVDALPLKYSLFQIFNMLSGPLACLICGATLYNFEHREDIKKTIRVVDPVIGIFLFLSNVLMICAPGRQAAQLVLQANPCNVELHEIEKMIQQAVPGVTAIHELHIWRLSPHKTLATVHVLFNTTENIIEKYESISYIFCRLHIDHVTIQPEFALTSDESTEKDALCQYPCSQKQLDCDKLKCCETVKQTQTQIVNC